MGFPTLDFNGVEGFRSTGLAGPDAIEGDLRELANMMDPGALLKSGQPGGVGAENMKAGVVDSTKVADGAVTTPKVAADAITTEKIAPGAVTPTELSDAAVTTAKIADLNVTTGKLADSAVTTTKIADANVTTAKLLDANVTTGKLADLAVTDAKLAANAVTTAKLLDANVTTAKLANGSVVTDKLADANVTEAKLAANAVTAAKLLDANVTTAKIADLNVTEGKLATGAVTETKLGTGSVTVGKLGDMSVSTAKLQDAAVTTAKLADGNVTAQKMSVASVGTSALQDEAVTTAKLAPELKQDTGSIAINARFDLVEGDVADHEVRLDAVESPATLTHTQTESVKSLPTGTLDGVVNNFETRGLSLVNSVVDGDFSGGTTGWGTGGTGAISIAAKVLSLVSASVAFSYAQQTAAYVIGDRYFFYCRARVTNGLCTKMAISTDAQEAGAITAPLANAWYDLYGAIVNSSGIRLRLNQTYPDAATANGKVMEIDGNAGVFAINMTALGIAHYTEAQMLDLVRGGYFDGLKGVENAEVKTVGKNLFSGRWRDRDWNYTNFPVRISTDDPIPVKAGLQYIATSSSDASFQHAMVVADKPVGGGIIDLVLWGTKTITPLKDSWLFPVLKNTAETAITPADVADYTLQIEQGSTATPYEPYKSSHLTITPTLRSLPNGVHDRVYEADGQVWLEKNVEEYTLVVSNIQQLYTDNPVDVVGIPLTVLSGVSATTEGIDNNIIVNGFGSEVSVSGAGWAIAENVWRIGTSILELRFIVPKATYANLAAAQAALAGTVIHYQLATPQLINLTAEGLTEGELQSFANGTVYLDADAFHVPSASFDVPTNTGAVIQSLVESANAQAKAIESKASKEQEDWIDLTLINGWTGTLKYRKNDFGELEVIGSTGAGTLTVGTIIATLPAGYRPSTARVAFHGYNVASGTVFAFVLSTTGDIILRQSGINAGNVIEFHVVCA